MWGGGGLPLESTLVPAIETIIATLFFHAPYTSLKLGGGQGKI